MILDRIMAKKRPLLRAEKAAHPLSAVKAAVRTGPAPRGVAFREALAAPGVSLIAEVKRASPSRGLLCPDLDPRRLARDLGVPVVPTVARYNRGLDELVQAVSEVARGEVKGKPYQVEYSHPALDRAVSTLAEEIQQAFPELPNAQWVALRLLDGDQRITEAVRKGELGELSYSEEEAAQN